MNTSKTEPAKPGKDSELYRAFIRNSGNGIWRLELETPLPTSLSLKTQIERIFQDAYLAEANDAFARMYGFVSAKPLIGTRLSDFMQQDHPEHIAYLKTFIKNGYELSGAELHETGENGADKYFRNSLVGTVVNGKLLRAWGTQQDVTDERSAVAALERSRERLSLALQSSLLGLWEWDIRADTLYWSDELKKLFGLKPSNTVTYKKYVQMIHPDDRAFWQDTISRHMNSGEIFQFEHRIVWPNGETHWMLCRGRSYSEGGNPVRMIGTTTNIDDAKQADELVAAYALLKKQRVQLLALNKTKDEFIALASHQLRTPATAVKQYLSLLLNEFAGPLTADQEQYLQVAFDSNERQLRIINDLLKTAQIDSHRYVLDKKQQNISEIIRICIRELRELFDTRKQAVMFEGPENITLSMDANEMKLVIMNLLENASKYSYPGTTIRIGMQSHETHVEIAVTDSGVGIGKADTRRIFEKFTRVNNELSDTVSGNGFGLYWVKRIITLHGGYIKVKSKLGEGSTFTIRLPL